MSLPLSNLFERYSNAGLPEKVPNGPKPPDNAHKKARDGLLQKATRRTRSDAF